MTRHFQGSYPYETDFSFATMVGAAAGRGMRGTTGPWLASQAAVLHSERLGSCGNGAADANVSDMLLQEFPPTQGRIVRRAHLTRLGCTSADIRAAANAGVVFRVRHGWYAHRDADPAVLAAVRSGAVVSCVSALSHHGVWSPTWFGRHPVTHTRRTEYRQRKLLPLQAGIHVCRGPDRDARPCPTAIDSLDDALRTAISCQPPRWLTVLLDSILFLQLRTPDELRLLAGSEQGLLHRALVNANGLAESGTETLTRLGLQRRKLRFRQQVRILGHRVDFLIGDRLVVEVDGLQYHSNPETFEADRLRDRRLTAAGYRVIRLTYRQVMHGLETALDDISRVIERGGHRR